MDKKQIKEGIGIAKQFYKELSKRFKIDKMFLVGSYARGEALRSRSDLDIVIVSDDFKDKKGISRIRSVSEYWTSFRAVDLIPLTVEEFERKRKGINVLAKMMAGPHIQIC